MDTRLSAACARSEDTVLPSDKPSGPEFDASDAPRVRSRNISAIHPHPSLPSASVSRKGLRPLIDEAFEKSVKEMANEIGEEKP